MGGVREDCTDIYCSIPEPEPVVPAASTVEVTLESANGSNTVSANKADNHLFAFIFLLLPYNVAASVHTKGERLSGGG